MVDIYSKQKRSEVMSKISGRGNKNTELALINILKENHIVGWRRNYPLVGKPDFVFTKEKLALFVDGCFWHCCPEHSRIPDDNKEFWVKKLNKNRERDKFVNEALVRRGWRVMRIWEHELKNPSSVTMRLKQTLFTV